MGVLICDEPGCNSTETYDGDPPKRTSCYKHHLKSMRLGFTWGKEQFHGPTIREQQAKQVADAAEAGREIRPVGQRWV